jgi:hypothetical protein
MVHVSTVILVAVLNAVTSISVPHAILYIAYHQTVRSVFNVTYQTASSVLDQVSVEHALKDIL